MKRFVYIVQSHRVRNKLINLNLLIHILLDKAGKLRAAATACRDQTSIIGSEGKMNLKHRDLQTHFLSRLARSPAIRGIWTINKTPGQHHDTWKGRVDISCPEPATLHTWSIRSWSTHFTSTVPDNARFAPSLVATLKSRTHSIYIANAFKRIVNSSIRHVDNDLLHIHG